MGKILGTANATMLSECPAISSPVWADAAIIPDATACRKTHAGRTTISLGGFDTAKPARLMMR